MTLRDRCYFENSKKEEINEDLNDARVIESQHEPIKTMNSAPVNQALKSPLKEKKSKTTTFKDTKDKLKKDKRQSFGINEEGKAINTLIEKNVTDDNDETDGIEYTEEELKLFKSIKNVLRPRKQFANNDAHIKLQELNRLNKEKSMKEHK